MDGFVAAGYKSGPRWTRSRRGGNSAESGAGPVALVTEIISPYRIPVLNELSRLLDDRLKVFFISETERRRSWPIYRDEIRFDYRVLGGTQIAVPIRGDLQPFYLAPPLLPHLVRGRFCAVVVGGWNHLECYWSLLYTKLWQKRFVLWSETPLLTTNSLRRSIRTAVKQGVVAAADAYVVPGASAARYLERLGARVDRIHFAPNAVDVAFWSQKPADVRRPQEPFVLYVGRLVRRKGPDVAVRAFSSSKLAARATLVVVGDGPERAELEGTASDRVLFLGNQTREELRRLYHNAELLLLPSRYDPWGLVLNEAACAGLAAIASDGAGATRDLVRHGQNGLIVPAGDVDALRQTLDRVADDPKLPQRLGTEAAKIGRTHTPTACARGLREAIE
jgi:glycosyltransferase involved in cell wall biosynthesis